MKNTALILPVLFAAWLLWITLRPSPLERLPGYTAPGVITKIQLPDNGRQLLLVREGSDYFSYSNVKVRDPITWKTLADLGSLPRIDSLYFQNDSLYLKTFSIRDANQGLKDQVRTLGGQFSD
ncbi:MAG: hypothetical protein ACI81P_002205 [Neolewinella sp.]|jgi:hypothetical protein